MNINTTRVGFGLRPGDPFWVQVREAVQQRAQELDITLVPVALPDFTNADDSIISTIEELKALELGALIMHVLPMPLASPQTGCSCTRIGVHA